MLLILIKWKLQKRQTNSLILKFNKTQLNINQYWHQHLPKLFQEKMLTSTRKISRLLTFKIWTFAHLHNSIMRKTVGNHKLTRTNRLTLVRLKPLFIKLNKNTEKDAILTVFKSYKRPSIWWTNPNLTIYFKWLNSTLTVCSSNVTLLLQIVITKCASMSALLASVSKF